MEIFRVTRQKYSTDLSGNGAAVNGGRWNEIGKPVLYAASSRSLAILETLVHLRQPQPPPDYRVMVLYVPDNVSLASVTDRQLPGTWKTDETCTQQVGGQWLKENEYLLLRVPSVIVKAEYNYLLNPAQEFFTEVQIMAIETIEFEPRFFQKLR
ncbi:RES family NAD+ phosphorylase [Spirosoma endophyticum]|uniref:RES domain-containing protein n=1 Tax=Spirosoma endophyticum TaxID=662367 RepID=A0A1I1VZ50_9BACT|nr:RES family NAD+ phosphorylase [Spirosoma endophyticum]SFD88105.1 RES domain-containing protein [Spirosoma endophyticum]